MFLRLTFLLFVTLLAALPAQPQPDPFARCMNKATGASYPGYFLTRGCLYNHLNRTDTVTAKIYVARLEEEAVRRADPRLRIYARDVYIEYVLRRRIPLPLDSILRQRKNLTVDAARLQDPAFIAWTEQNLANALYLLAHQYDRAFEIHLRVYAILRRYSGAEIPDRNNFLGTIGHHYYDFAEYRQAIHFLSEAVAGAPAPGAGSYDWRQAYNTLGLCYRQLGLYDSSDYYFRQVLRVAISEERRDWTGIARGNLGINLYRRRRFAEARPLLTEDARASIERGDWSNAAGALLPLAGIALEEGRVEEGAAMLETARSYITLRDATARLPLYYSLRIREAAARGDGVQVAALTDSLASIKDSLARQFSTLHLARAEQRLQTAGMRAQLAISSAQQRVAKLQRNALLIILALSAGLAALTISYYRRRRREVAKRSAADLRAKEADLQAAQSMLERFRQDVHEKAVLIEQLSAQLDEEEHGAVLQQLRDSTILTDEHWAEFRRLFEQVHTGFIARLVQRHPGLSPSEVRFLVLARLGFSSKEMAGALGVAPSTMRVTWHRLRRKLGLDEEAQVGTLVEGI